MSRYFLIVLLAVALLAISFNSFSQLNVQLLHQLVDESKSEHQRQADARSRQAVVSSNEEANKTLLENFKNKYREVENRFKTVGLAIDALQIALDTVPIVEDIIKNQQEIFSLAYDDPILILMAYRAEEDMGEQAYQLVNYLYGLALSIDDITQMRPSDRKLLFGHVISELRAIAGASRGLASTMAYARAKKSSLNPFAGFINRDKKLIDDILTKSKILIR